MNGKKVWTITIKLNQPKYFDEDESFIFITELIELWLSDYYNDGFNIYYKLDCNTDNTINQYYTKYEHDNNDCLYHITLVELLKLLNIDTQLCDSVYLELCSLSNDIDNFMGSLIDKYPDSFLSIDLLELNKIKSKITQLKHCIKKDKNMNSNNTTTCTLIIKLEELKDETFIEEISRSLNETIDYLLYELDCNNCTNIYFNLDLGLSDNIDYSTCEDYIPYNIIEPAFHDYMYIDVDELLAEDKYRKDIRLSINQFTEKIYKHRYLSLNKLEDNYEWIYRLVMKQI